MGAPLTRASRGPAHGAPFAFAPRFEFVRTLGAGAMGTVHEVFDTERRVRMALKALHAKDADSLLYFKREFRALCDLRHPNLVSLGDLVDAGGEWFFTMELVEGTDFLSHVRPVGDGSHDAVTPTEQDAFAATLPVGQSSSGFHEARLREAFRQMAAGLSHLHRAGKLHRDLKPSNVMVTAADRVVILDFGLVMDRRATVTAVRDHVVGTLLYMAPEQAAGEDVGPAADWYAFGTMLYEALTGRLPCEGTTVADIIQRKRLAEHPSPLLLAPDAPPDLVALCRALLRLHPADRPEEGAIRAALGVDDDRSWVALTGFGAPEQIFVGRKEELAALEDGFARCSAGHGVTVVVEGESGVGKSALVETFVRRLTTGRLDAIVLRSRCREQEALSYRAFDGWMDDLSRVLLRMDRRRVAAIAPRHTVELLALFPCLAAVRALTQVPAERRRRSNPELEPPPESTADLRVHGFAAAIELLRSVAARHPLVAVIDDVQWADRDSLLLLEDLVAPEHVPSWCLIVTERRSKAEDPCAARRFLRGDVRVLTLEGLGADDARQLARHLMKEGSGSVPPRAIDEAVADSKGHPLFLSRLASHLTRVHPSRSTFTLDDALWAEIASLPATGARILGVLAVAGAPVELGALAEAAEVLPEVFVAELSRLRAARLARIHGSRRDDTAEPYHDRVRETLLARLSLQDRRTLHRALALALESTGAEDDRVAVQWRLAENGERAVERARRAIDALERGGAFGRAAEMARLVLDVAAPPGPERGRWLVRLGENLGRAGRPKEAADAYGEAAALPHLAKEERVELERRATEQLLTGGYLDAGLALARQVLADVGVSFPGGRWSTVIATAWTMWRARSLSLQRPAEGTADADEATRAAHRLRIDARWTAGSGLVMLEPVMGTALLAAGLGEALAHGDAMRRARALCAASFAECGAIGALEHAERFTEAAEREAAETGSGAAGLYASLARADIELMVKLDFPACLAALRVAEAHWRDGEGGAWERSIVEHFLCFALFLTGDLRGSRERREAALRRAHLGGHRYLETGLRTTSLPMLLFDDDPSSALADLDDVERGWLPGHTEYAIVDYWCVKAKTDVFFYRPTLDAVAPLAAAWRAFEGTILRRVPILHYESSLHQAGFAHLAARLAAVAGRERDRATWSERAAAMTRRYARFLTSPSGRLMAANPHALKPAMALANGDRAAAMGALRESVAWLEQHGRVGYAQAERHLLGRLVGGDEGRALTSASHDWFLGQGVRNPEAFARAIRLGVTE